MFLRQVLLQSVVRELALDPGMMLPLTATVAQAAEEMRAQSHGSALICDQGKLVGVFTERDLLRFLTTGRPMSTPITEVMTSDPRSVGLDDTLMHVIQLMDQGAYRRLPVVNSQLQPMGIVDVKVVVHFLVEHFPAGVYNQAAEALQTTQQPEGA